jgi:microcin C transport system substrate-binding protein
MKHALIRLVLLAKHYDNLVAAVRALDRVLLWNHYVVPQWSYNKLRVARWDRFSHPDPLPKYGISGFPSLWWWDGLRASSRGNGGTTHGSRSIFPIDVV